MEMGINEFMAMVENHLTKLAGGSMKLKGLKALAYELAEKDHINMTGQRRFANYGSFSSCRTRTYEPKTNTSGEKIFVASSKKRAPVYKKTEFDSKFNWLF